MNMKILIVDDEVEVLNSLKRILKREGINNVTLSQNGSDAVNILKNENFDIVLLDLMLPDIDGLKVLEQTKPFKPETEFIMITAVDDVRTAISAIKLGAYEYVIKPIEPERLMLVISRAYERKGLISSLSHKTEATTKRNKAFERIITQSKEMLDIFNYTEIMAKTGNPVMITGESGTGKELFARAIHQLWAPKGPFIAVNVASIPESLFESQFFGHAKGAFTGANQSHVGYFKQAHGGTLFLDEIGELPLNQQAKLLRVLEEKIIYPIGETKAIPVDVRIISATNVDIDEACREGKFRLDLLYRLKSSRIHLPALRERFGDIPLLAEHFLNLYKDKYQKNELKFTNEALEVLMKRDFPGNIREFSQTIENAVILSEKDLILPKNLGTELISKKNMKDFDLCTLKENSYKHIVKVLTYTNGDKKSAADILGISLRQLQRKVSEIRSIPGLREMIDKL